MAISVQREVQRLWTSERVREWRAVASAYSGTTVWTSSYGTTEVAVGHLCLESSLLVRPKGRQNDSVLCTDNECNPVPCPVLIVATL